MPRLPSSQDVQQVSPRIAADPGVSAPAGAFASPVGIAAGEMAPGFEKLAEVARRREDRRDTIDRSTHIDDKNLENDTELRNIETQGLDIGGKKLELSDERVLMEYSKRLTENRMRRIEEHRNAGASEDSIARLTVRLQGIDSEYIGRATAISTKLGREKVLTRYNNALSPLIERISQNPTNKQVNDEILNLETVIEDIRGAFDPADEDKLRQFGTEQLALKAIDSALNRGRIDEAEGLMSLGGLGAKLSPQVQREKLNQIERARFSQEQTMRELQMAEALSAAKERGQLTVKLEFLDKVLAKAGAPMLPIGPQGDESSAVTQPFGAGVPVSQDMQEVNRLMLASRRLLSVGETQIANGLMSQARFLADNSPSILRSRELDKPISADLASELGAPIGTPLRAVIGRLPRSPEEVAEAGAAARARGTGRVEAEEQMSFISEARDTLKTLLTEIKEDPGIVGVRGSLRSTGQTAVGVLGELGLSNLVESARNIAFSESDLSTDDFFKMFDSPTLSVLHTIENSVGLILARMRQPDGRLSVDVIQRSISDMKLRGLTSSKQVENRLNFILGILNQRAGSIERRFNMKQPQESLPRFRVENGRLVPAEE